MLRNNLATFNSEWGSSVKAFPGLKILVVLLIPLFFGACAVDKPPTGGPPDNSPLRITASMPETDVVNTSPKEIRLGFSHYVSREALVNSIFFSPAVTDYEVEAHGKEAVLRLYSPLKQNRTYTLTLRQSLKSLYGNHQLDRSWTLAFSTGPVIDKGTINGRVWTNRMAPASGITVMGFTLPASGNALAASAAATSRPDHLVQTGPSGEFQLDNLAAGKYRVVAMIDNNGNGQFDPGKDSFGVTSIPAIETGATGVALRLSPENFAAISLRSCKTINDREIEITFSAPISSRTVDLSTIKIENTGTGAALPVLAWFSPSRSNEANTWRVLTAPMSGTAQYRLRFSPRGAGSASSELTFSGNPRKERYPELSVTILPADGSNNVMPETIRLEAGPSAELRFNLPVDESSLRTAVTLASIGKEGKRPVQFTISRIDSRTFCVLPSGGFRHEQDYALAIHPELVRTIVGNPASGAKVTESKFSVAGAEAYGEITGSGTATGSTAVIEARQSGQDIMQRMVVKPSGTGSFNFSFHDLPPGEYAVTGFIPSAFSETRWNEGNVEPFRPSDPFVAVTVKVRAGWTTENVKLDIPSTILSVNGAITPEKP
jgi:uncharacterized protein (DUF2141 family)